MYIPENEQVTALIREVGVHRLANFDGCVCSRFSVRNVDVKIGCGKGRDRAIWLSSNHGDYRINQSGPADLKLFMPIATEIANQLKRDVGYFPAYVRDDDGSVKVLLPAKECSD